MTGLGFLLSLALVISPALAAGSPPSNQPTVQFTWKSKDQPVIEAQQEYLRSKGAEVGEIEEQDPGTRNPALVVLFVIGGVAAISELAHSIVDVVKEYKHGGLVVDAQGEELKINDNPSLKQGQILVRTRDGDVKLLESQSHSGTDLAELVSSLAKLMKSTKKR